MFRVEVSTSVRVSIIAYDSRSKSSKLHTEEFKETIFNIFTIVSLEINALVLTMLRHYNRICEEGSTLILPQRLDSTYGHFIVSKMATMLFRNDVRYS